MIRRVSIISDDKKIVLGIVCPIILGALVYLILDPNILFISMLGLELKRGAYLYDGNIFFCIIRNYFPDAMWAISLTAFVIFLYRNRNSFILPTFFVFILGAFIELLQYMQVIHGTGDVFDVLIEIFFSLLTCFFYKRRIKQ